MVMPITVEQRIDDLKQARKLIKRAMTAFGIPQLESTLQEADMNLHWALWNLGQIDELRPELESQQDKPRSARCSNGVHIAE